MTWDELERQNRPMELIHAAIELARTTAEAVPAGDDLYAEGALRSFMEVAYDRPGEFGQGEVDCWKQDLLQPLNDGYQNYILCEGKKPLEDGYTLVRLHEREVDSLNEALETRGMIFRPESEVKADEKAEEEREAAEAAAERERTRNYMNDEDRAALFRFADANGRFWKRELRDLWMNGFRGDEPDAQILQSLRNRRFFGPAGLEKFSLAKERRFLKVASAS